MDIKIEEEPSPDATFESSDNSYNFNQNVKEEPGYDNLSDVGLVKIEEHRMEGPIQESVVERDENVQTNNIGIGGVYYCYNGNFNGLNMQTYTNQNEYQSNNSELQQQSNSNNSKMEKRLMSANEKTCLTRLVAKYRSIIECKKTDVVSMNKKKRGWVKLAVEFNAVPENCQRTEKQLWKAWENQKCRRRRALALEKREKMAMEGGSYKSPEEDANDIIIDGLLQYPDVEIKDSIDTNNIAPPVVKEIPSISHCKEPLEQSPTPRKIILPLNIAKPDCGRKGAAIPNEFQLERNRILMRQEAEIHQLNLREREIKIEIELSRFKEQKAKTELALLLLKKEKKKK